MSIKGQGHALTLVKGQGHALTLVKGHSGFKVKRLTFGLYTQVSDSGPQGPLVTMFYGNYYDNYGYFGIFHGYFGFQLRE